MSASITARRRFCSIFSTSAAESADAIAGMQADSAAKMKPRAADLFMIISSWIEFLIREPMLPSMHQVARKRPTGRSRSKAPDVSPEKRLRILQARLRGRCHRRRYPPADPRERLRDRGRRKVRAAAVGTRRKSESEMLRYKTRPRTCGRGLAARPNRILREFPPRNRRTRLALRFLRRLARIPVRGDVAVTSDTVRRVRAEPDDGRCHHARGNQILAIEPRFLWHHRRVGW